MNNHLQKEINDINLNNNNTSNYIFSYVNCLFIMDCFSMSSKARVIRKTFRTKTAFIWFFTSMNPHVTIEMVRKIS